MSKKMIEERLTRQQIEQKIYGKGDYVVMNFLSNCLKKDLDFDARRFALVKLCGLYEARRMFIDAGKLMSKAADINTTSQSKINDFVKSAELLIRGGDYDVADMVMRRAIALANSKQNQEIKNKIKEVYKSQAKQYEQRDKRKHAMKAYEKILELELDQTEKAEVENKLMNLYNQLGKIREYYSLAKRNK